MKRRNFLRTCALSGLTLTVGSSSRADEPYQGRFLIVVLAVGGLDPTMMGDPRGAPINRTFSEGDILTEGNFRFAPIPGASRFFGRHRQQMVLVNGINFATGSHEAGVRYASSGHLGTGYPTLAALYAASQGPSLPLAYLTYGGYENDEGTIPPVRNLNAFIFGDVADPDKGLSGRYHSDWAQDLIVQSRDTQLQERAVAAGLPRYRQSQESVLAVRPGVRKLGLLRSALPELDTNEQKRQIQIGMAAFRAGVGIALNVAAYPGFDTHRDHDREHTVALVNLYEYLEYIWNEAERQNIADRLDVVLTSDFGRTAYYDSEADGNGKGHWPIGSMLVISNQLPRPNRLVGSTDEELNAVGVDPVTLEPSPTGVMLTPEIVHDNVRRVLGIADSPISQKFPLRPSADLALF